MLKGWPRAARSDVGKADQAGTCSGIHTNKNEGVPPLPSVSPPNAAWGW